MGLASWGRAVLWGSVLLVPALQGPVAVARADGEEVKKEARPVIDATQVYFGKPSCCKAPAVVDADQVFRAIPEYKQILERKLTEKDVEYSLLMIKAARRFRAAVEEAATDGSYDLVANIGAVTWEGHVIPDITDRAIAKVEEQK